MGCLGYGRSRLQESRLWGSRLRESRLRESRLCPSTVTVQMKYSDVDSVISFESFKALRLKSFESFRALKFLFSTKNV